MGTFQLKLDDKGRLSIPVRYREIIHSKYHPELEPTAPEFVLSSIGSRISVYPRAEWDILADALTEACSLPSLHQDARDLYHVLFGNAAESGIDSQGRILIPPHLRTKASLNGDLTIVGLNRYFDIWGRDAWEEYQSSLRGREEEIAQKIVESRDARVYREARISRRDVHEAFDTGLRPPL